MSAKEEKKDPLVERAGIWYLKKLAQKEPLKRVDYKTYILDKHERKHINSIERRAIINSLIAGTVSTIVSGLAAFLADPLNDDNASIFSSKNMTYWAIVLGSTILASLVEIFYIYYDVMKKTFSLAHAAHMDLFPKDKDIEEIAAPIVRAALELPNKREKDINIDPKRESSKMLVLISTLFYKLKVSVSNFLLKALVKRTLGRAISRAWLNFLAVPVCAFWDAIVCWLVIREVKIRVLGPSAISEILNTVKQTLNSMSDIGKLSVLRAIGSSIVRTADMHPNLEFMYRSFNEHIAEPKNVVMDDSYLFLHELKNVPDNEKLIVLQTLVYATIIDGRINFREKKLLQRAYRVCNIPFVFSNISNLLQRFRSGKLLEFNIVDK